MLLVYRHFTRVLFRVKRPSTTYRRKSIVLRADLNKFNKSYSNTTNDSHPTSKKIDKISVSKVNSLFKNLSKSHFIYSDISSVYDGLDKFIHLTPRTKYNFFLQFLKIWVGRS